MKKMKSIYTLLLALLCAPLSAFANAELVQIVALSWNEVEEKLEPISFGSGTAIAKDTVITNKHVVKVSGQVADFLLLCPAQVQENRGVKCTVPAAISALHNTLDVALVKTLDPKDFLFAAKTSTVILAPDNVVRVVGFPTVGDDYAQNFGSTKTVEAFESWQENPSLGLDIKGDTPTITRGKVLARYMTESDHALYTKTDAKVNFGNSGGAAFDQVGGYVGIPTLKDEAGNSFILEYAQFHDWVTEHSSRKARPNEDAYAFYQTLIGAPQKAPATTTVEKSSRYRYLESLAAQRGSGRSSATRRTTSRNYYSPYRSYYYNRGK